MSKERKENFQNKPRNAHKNAFGYTKILLLLQLEKNLILTFRLKPLQLQILIIMLTIKGTLFKAAETRKTVHGGRCGGGACPSNALQAQSFLERCRKALSAAAASVTFAGNHLLHLQSVLS